MFTNIFYIGIYQDYEFFYKAIPEYRKVKRLNVVKYLLFKTLWKIDGRFLAEIIPEILSPGNWDRGRDWKL